MITQIMQEAVPLSETVGLILFFGGLIVLGGAMWRLSKIK